MPEYDTGVGIEGEACGMIPVAARMVLSIIALCAAKKDWHG